MIGDRAVLDASVAVPWLVREPASPAALELFRSSTRWMAPRLLITEVAGALARKVQLNEFAARLAHEAVATLLRSIQSGIIELAADEDHIEQALRTSIELRHPAADCLYLAVARVHGLSLATADDKLARVARRQRISVTFVSAG